MSQTIENAMLEHTEINGQSGRDAFLRMRRGSSEVPLEIMQLLDESNIRYPARTDVAAQAVAAERFLLRMLMTVPVATVLIVAICMLAR